MNLDLEKYIKLLFVGIFIYIVNNYLGYALYTDTFSLLSSNSFPKDVLYWILVECCFWGIILTLVNTLAFTCLVWNFETFFAKKEYNGFKFKYLILLIWFPVLNNTKRYLFTKLRNYLVVDLDDNEKVLLINIKKYDKENKFIYTQLLNSQYIEEKEVDQLKSSIYTPIVFANAFAKLINLVKNKYQTSQIFYKELAAPEYALILNSELPLEIREILEKKADFDRTIAKTILKHLQKYYPFLKKGSKIYKSITDKLELTQSLKLSEMNKKTLIQSYTSELSNFKPTIEQLINDDMANLEKENIAKFIYNPIIFNKIATPFEKIFYKFKNNVFVNIITFISAVSYYAFLIILLLLCWFISQNNPNGLLYFAIGEVVYFLFLYIMPLLTNAKPSLKKILLPLTMLIVCFAFTIILITPYIVNIELKRNNWFHTIKEIKTHSKETINSNQLFIDINILNQLRLQHFGMINDCSNDESKFCYTMSKETQSTSFPLLKTESYFQLKNFRTLYMVNLNESNQVYLKDHYGRMFNLNKYGNYYIRAIESTTTPESEPVAPIKSCVAIPSYGARLALYSESEFRKNCMYYISDDKINCFYPFNKVTSCK